MVPPPPPPSRASTVPVEHVIDACVVAALDQELHRAAPRRVSGFLLGHSSGVVVSAQAFCPALKPTGRKRETSARWLSGADYQRALRRARRLGCKVVASYRTHPNGDPSVSVPDVARFRRSRLALLIVTGRPNGAQPKLDAYAPPLGAPITVAVGRGGDDPA